MITLARHVSVAAFALLVPRFGIAQGPVVALQVIDDATDAPLPEVRVSIIGEGLEGVTDEKGRCVVIARKAGKLPVLLRKLGYSPASVMVDVSSTDTTRLTVAMSSSVQTLGTVTVCDTMNSGSSMLSGFHHRLQIGVDGSLKAEGFDLNMIPVSEIYGIEFYPGPATIPREFASSRRESGCGLIMVWTRRGSK